MHDRNVRRNLPLANRVNTDWYRVEEVAVAFRCYAFETSYKIVLALPMHDLQFETETKRNEKGELFTSSTDNQ